MKIIDVILRRWRTKKALSHCPKHCAKILDIGCGTDAYLLQHISWANVRHGIEPLDTQVNFQGITLFQESFPENIEHLIQRGPYDVIFALAVFEHLSTNEFTNCQSVFPDLLNPGGKLILTVPEPAVDKILDILEYFHLIDGLELHQHHGFIPSDLLLLNSEYLKLSLHKKFQFGLNNLFIFTRL